MDKFNEKKEIKNRILILATFTSVTVTILYLCLWVALACKDVFDPVDFWTYYTAAALVRDGYGNQLYDIALQTQYQLQIKGAFPLNGDILPFVGPPHLAIALVPLAMLPHYWAYCLWLALQMIFLFLFIYFYIKESTKGLWPERIMFLGAFISFPMLFVTFYKGQFSLIILLCIFLWLKDMRKPNNLGIAIWLLIGSIKPQFMVVPCLLTILARRWKAIAYFLAGGTLIATLCVISLDHRCIHDFVLSMVKVDSSVAPTPYPIFMYNFKGFLALILGIESIALIRLISFVGFLCALIVVVSLWRGRIFINDEKFNLKMALSLLLGIFFCPYLFYYDTLLLVVVAIIFHDYLIKSVKGIAGWVFIAMMYLIPVLFLESSWIPIDGHIVRWPVILMILWMLSITAIILFYKDKQHVY